MNFVKVWLLGLLVTGLIATVASAQPKIDVQENPQNFEYIPNHPTKVYMAPLFTKYFAPSLNDGAPMQVSIGDRITINGSWIDNGEYKRALGSTDANGWMLTPALGPYEVTIEVNGQGLTLTRDGQVGSQITYMSDGFLDRNTRTIETGNVYLNISQNWDEQPFTVTAKLKDQGVVPLGSEGSVVDPVPSIRKLDFVKRGPYAPKHAQTMLPGVSNSTVIEGGEQPGEIVFEYMAIPDEPRKNTDPPANQNPPYYTNQVVDEILTRFATFDVTHLAQGWKDDTGIMDVDLAARYLFKKEINTSFPIHVQDGRPDRFLDRHNLTLTAIQKQAFTPEALAAGIVGERIEQTYISGGNILGLYVIILKHDPATNGSKVIKTKTG